MKILFLSPVYPYPPNDGDTIRIFNIINQLKQNGRHKMNLITFCKEGEEKNNVVLNKYFDSIETIVLKKSEIITGAMKGIFSKEPLNSAAYKSKAMSAIVNKAVEKHKPDLIFVYRLRMAQYVKEINVPKVIDFVDSLALYMKRSAAFESSLIKRLYYNFDYLRVDKYEREQAARFKAVYINSDEDAAYLASKNIITAPNGAIKSNIKKGIKNSIYTIGFMGNMPYGPNKEAVIYFIKKVWKKSFNNDKNIRLVIAGKGSAKFSGLIESSNIVFKNRVENVAAEVSSWDASVVPVRYGAGRQNKVMDCWACKVPVIAAPFAASGVYGVDGYNLLIAKSDGEFVSKIRELQMKPELGKNLARNAANTLKKYFDWKKTAIIINKSIIKAVK